MTSRLPVTFENPYSGWNSSTNLPTGPTHVLREDRANGYFETLTMSATPSLTNGLPNGSEAVSSLQSLSRRYASVAGQVLRQDDYFNVGMTYSTSTYIGQQGTNYFTTQFAFDNRGRLNQTTSPSGTVDKTTFDGLGRPTATYLGATQVSATAYDSGGVGDSNVTQVTLYPGGGASNRVSNFYYDWRNRQVAARTAIAFLRDMR